MRVILFRIPAHIPEASQAESSLFSLLFIKGNPANMSFSPSFGERYIDNDGAQPGNEARLPAEPINVSNGAQHCLLNQVARIIRIRGITVRKAVKHIQVAAEQFTQSAGLSVLGCDDEFFIASLPTATFNGHKRGSGIPFARRRQVRVAFQLHCILQMRPESARF
jgi:hypothetical protein